MVGPNARLDPVLAKVLKDFAENNGLVRKNGSVMFTKTSFFAGKKLREMGFGTMKIAVVAPKEPEDNKFKKQNENKVDFRPW